MLIVSVAVPLPVTDAGVNEAVAPDGRPLTLRFTMPVKPFCAVTWVVHVPPLPTALTRKSGTPEVASGLVMLTLSNTAVLSFVLFCDVTAMPAYTVPVSPTDTVLPICCHAAPSEDAYAVRFPLARTSRTHSG